MINLADPRLPSLLRTLHQYLEIARANTQYARRHGYMRIWSQDMRRCAELRREISILAGWIHVGLYARGKTQIPPRLGTKHSTVRDLAALLAKHEMIDKILVS